MALNEQVSEPVRHRAISVGPFDSHSERWNQLAGGNCGKESNWLLRPELESNLEEQLYYLN